ncbi:LysE family translocator [Desulfobacula sp.]|uniref:LysE family translocator n=1 Tax=Desulfobacula sp. TaxID=2593537 RepID=UPI0026335E13|nr:LysE family translocator [Desulfobacula sp.]
MIESSVLIVFIPTFFVVSVTPGMCMTLALTMGMTIGVKRTFYMMYGELLGVGMVSVAAVSGVAAIMLNYPLLFTTLKYMGGLYLVYLGFQMIRSKGNMSLTVGTSNHLDLSPKTLMIQGFVTAIANPKGWAFMISLLPPFIHPSKPFIPQLGILVMIILTTEFFCLVLYSNGGRSLSRFLEKKGNVRLLNRISGALMMAVGIWLGLG